MEYKSISSIAIPSRQRHKHSLTSQNTLIASIATVGLLHPITCNYDSSTNSLTLVAGERRLRALLALHSNNTPITYSNTPIPHNTAPVVLLSNLSPYQQFEIELDENLKRENLTWQEETKALSDLHTLRKTTNPTQTFSDTATEVKTSRTGSLTPATPGESTRVSQATLISKFLDDPDIAQAPNSSKAFRLIKEKLEAEFTAALDRTALPTITPHTLHHDSISNHLDLLPSNTFSCIIADPPYGISTATHGTAQMRRHEYDESDSALLYKTLFDVADRCATSTAHLYLFLDIDFFTTYRNELTARGWRVRRTPLIWHKGTRGHTPEGAATGYRREHEYILFAFRPGSRCHHVASDVLPYPSPHAPHHAAQKPTTLYETLLSQSTILGDHILDPFAGSGVIFSAASALSLTATGIELAPKAVALIESNHSVYRSSISTGQTYDKRKKGKS